MPKNPLSISPVKTLGDFGKEFLNTFFSEAELIQTLHRNRANPNLLNDIEANCELTHQIGQIMWLIRIQSLCINTWPNIHQI
jgi:hypothetical protein